MKKNRYFMLLAALPLLASCSGSPKEVEAPEINFDAYSSSEVTFEAFKTKIEELQENYSWGKEDFKAPSYTAKSVDYTSTLTQDSKDGVVYSEFKSAAGSEYEGGYDVEHKVIYITTNSSLSESTVNKTRSESGKDVSVSHMAYEEIHTKANTEATQKVARVYEDSREYSTMNSTIEELAIETFTSVGMHSKVFSIVAQYPHWGSDRQEQYKFYHEGSRYTVTRTFEDVDEDKDLEENVIERVTEKYNCVYQVEVSDSKIVARYVDKYEYIDEGFTEDSDIGKGMKYYSMEEERGEAVAETGEYSHKAIDISGFQSR